MHAQHATDPDRVETPVVDQPPDRLRVNAELACDLANAHQTDGIFPDGRHNRDEVCQVSRSAQNPRARHAPYEVSAVSAEARDGERSARAEPI